jgi:pilus assembly protein CpaB
MKGFKQRKGINVLVFITAIGLAGGGTYLADKQIKQRIAAETERLYSERNAEYVKVVVPKVNISRGTILRETDIQLREVPKTWVHSSVITETSYKAALGQVFEFDADGGKPLLWAHLKGDRVPTFSGRVLDGQRALTINVDKISSISGFLEPDDRIDLILTYEQNKREVSKPLLQNVLVLASGEKVEIEEFGVAGAQPKQVSTATLMLAPEDAKRIIHAQTVGKITAMLRHPKDNKPINSDSMTEQELFGKVAYRAPPKKPVIETRGIEYIVGGVGQ